VTVDAFLGGRVEAVQPASGHHRAGLEAVLLAASVAAATEGAVFDLGAADIETRDGLGQGTADAVVFNPPFRGRASGSSSPQPARADAHVLGEGGLDPWFRAAAALLRSGGTATVIFRADGLDLVLAATEGRFGGLEILPVHPRQGEPALRVLVRGIKGSRAPLRLLPGIVLHRDSGNGFRPEIEAILRDGADLVTAVPAWQKHAERPS
jgi:tRNA1(Val) A37 N6-methylase TrmN6